MALTHKLTALFAAGVLAAFAAGAASAAGMRPKSMARTPSFPARRATKTK